MAFSVTVELLNMASRRAQLSRAFRGIRDPAGRNEAD
jgi:hypothetical protein